VARKAAPAVHPDVVAGAELLAKSIWDGGGKPARDLVPQRADPRHIAPLLAYAVDQGWLRIQDGMVVPGHVNPRPVPEVLSARQWAGRWGPSNWVRL
jgi:hypothetical protein